jgi:hypothetical protein
VLLELVGVVLGRCERQTRRNDALDAVRRFNREALGGTRGHARWVVGQVEEEGDSVERAVLLKVLSEEARRLHVDTHGGKDDGKVVVMIVVNALTGLGDETRLPTDLRGNLRGG